MNRALIFCVIFFLGAVPAVYAQTDTPAKNTIPSNEIEQFDFANGLFARGMYDMAIKAYKDLLKEYPDTALAELAEYRIAECYFLDKKKEEALNRYGNLIEKYPDGDLRDKARLRQGQIFYDSGDTVRSEKIFRALAGIEDSKAYGPAKYYLAVIKFNDGDLDGSMSILEELARVEGEEGYMPFVHMTIGDIYAEQKLYDKAALAYAKCSEIAPDDRVKGQSDMRAANSWYSAGQPQKALKYYRRVMDSGPDDLFDGAALSYMSVLYKEGEKDRLIEESPEVVDKVKDVESAAQIYFMKANVLFGQEKYPEAARIYGIAGEKFPGTKYGERSALNECWALYNMGEYARCLGSVDLYLERPEAVRDEALYIKAKALSSMGSSGEAAGVYEELVSDHPGSRFFSEARYEAGALMSGQGAHKEAADHFLDFYNDYPSDKRAPSALLQSAQESLKAGDTSGAESAYGLFMQEYPDDPLMEKVVFQAARLYAGKDEHDRALELFDRFLDTYGRSSGRDAALYWKARSLMEKGQWKKAIKALEGLVGSDSDGDYAPRAREALAFSLFRAGEAEASAEAYYSIMNSVEEHILPESVYMWAADRFLSSGKHDRSLKVLSAYAEAYPDKGELSDTEYIYGDNYLGLREWDKAIQHYSNAIEGNASSPYLERSYLGRGRAYLAKGDPERALEDLNNALESNGDDLTGAMARFEIGNIKREFMEFEEAARQYMMVAILYEDGNLCPEALLRAGDSFERAGNTSKAQEAYRELMDRYPESPQAKKLSSRDR